MLDAPLVTRSAKMLFDVELEPGEKALRALAEGEIRTLRGRKNRVSIGEPQAQELVTLLKAKEGKIPPDIKAMLGQYEFWQVRLSCTFRPDDACEFVWARFGVRLLLESQALEPGGSPVAYDMFPREIKQEAQYRGGISFKPVLKFSFIEVGAEVSGSHDTIRYQPEMIAGGLLEPAPYWDLRKVNTAIKGSKEFFLLVKKPKGTQVLARFEIGARVQDRLLGQVPLGKFGKDPLLEATYPLC